MARLLAGRLAGGIAIVFVTGGQTESCRQEQRKAERFFHRGSPEAYSMELSD